MKKTNKKMGMCLSSQLQPKKNLTSVKPQEFQRKTLTLKTLCSKKLENMVNIHSFLIILIIVKLFTSFQINSSKSNAVVKIAHGNFVSTFDLVKEKWVEHFKHED